MRRVVVTGLGLVTPLGGDVETSWANIIASRSGAGPITRFDASEQKCRIASEVKPADHAYGSAAAQPLHTQNKRQCEQTRVYDLYAPGKGTQAPGKSRRAHCRSIERQEGR